jgi:hypothetical protein
MRTLLIFLAGVLCSAIVAALAVLAAGHPSPQQATVLGTTLHASGRWALVTATALGFLLALILLLPRRLATAARSEDLEAQVRLLHVAYAQVLASYQQVLVQHQQVQQVLRAVMAPHSPGPSVDPSIPSVPSPPGLNAPAASTQAPAARM